MVLCVLALLPATWLYVATGDRLRTTADAPRTEVAIVFGAGLWGGEPSPYLAHRLDAAAKLYRAGRIEVVLVTGDNSRKDYDEPDAMRAYLTAHGVPGDGSSATTPASTPGTPASAPARSSASTRPS